MSIEGSVTNPASGRFHWQGYAQKPPVAISASARPMLVDDHLEAVPFTMAQPGQAAVSPEVISVACFSRRLTS